MICLDIIVMPQFADFALPEAGSWTPIAEGVYWLRMPLPFDLDHINLYLLEDVDGWFVVDTGLGTETTKKHWTALFEKLDKPVKGVIVTHMHPDHIGNAGWITEQFQVPLWMTQAEYYTGRALLSVRSDASRWSDEAFFKAAGLNEDDIHNAVYGNKGFASVISPIPLAYNRLQQGTILEINGNRWEVMIGRGHSPEHACLYCQERHLLLSGDHVLPAISPNIGVYSTEPESNPLADYLQTLAPMKALPAKTLVLPAHNQPFYGLHERVQSLIDHHKEHLDRLLDACRERKTVVECLPVLFTRKLTGRNVYFALAECLSHLNLLFSEGRIIRVMEDGVHHYQTVSGSELKELPPLAEMEFLQV